MVDDGRIGVFHFVQVIWDYIKQRGAPRYEFPNFTVLQGPLINEGGYAYVYQAKDEKTDKIVVLKKIICQSDERLRDARSEANYLQLLQPHPNIVQFYGLHELYCRASKSTVALLCLEWCSKGTLLDRIMEKNHGQRLLPHCLKESFIVCVLQQIASGLDHIHSSNPTLVHYDLKPENVLFTSTSSLRLCDFGSASTRTFGHMSPAAVEDFFMGRTTPFCRPPEVADPFLRLPIGPPADIFMLGTVLYTMMFGLHPFPMDTKLANIQAKYTIPEGASSRYSEALLSWLRRLLAKRPCDRPTAGALILEIEAFLANKWIEGQAEVAHTGFNPEEEVGGAKNESPGFDPKEEIGGASKDKPVWDEDGVQEAPWAADFSAQ